ncbi:MAG: HypC/HybG/HupF family hydrogenase formation chaperone [Maritimibacter sp.]|jgi:hydrogenase expression/formation protein HypC
MCLGIPGLIVGLTDKSRMMAMADVSGVRREVNLMPVTGEVEPESLIGKWVLIHVGFAMSVIDEEEAAATIAVLRELGEAQQELAAMAAGDAALERG